MDYLWKSDGKRGWMLLLNFLRKEREVGEVIKRTEILESNRRLLRKTTVDTYIGYLRKAGYLRTITPGVYRIEKRIPAFLSMNMCRIEAYGGAVDTDGWLKK